MADPYATLGVARDASEADIKKAYRTLAKELHPDRNKDNRAASDRFSKVTQAYDVLTDKAKRARFDRGEIDGDGNPAAPFGYGGGPGGGFRAGPGPRGGFEQGGDGQGGDGQGGDFSDIFDGLFGGRGGAGGGFSSGFGRRAQQKGGNVAYRLKVPFEDAATLAAQRITLADGKTIDLKLPAGVDNGTQMRLTGKGDPGPGGAGDAIVTVEVQPHRFYTRVGDDVRIDLPIGLAEAVLGARIRVPTVEGTVMLSVPRGSTSGRTLRLKGRGFHRKDGGRGDQLVTVMVDLPADDDALVAFVQGWDGRSTDPRGRFGV